MRFCCFTLLVLLAGCPSSLKRDSLSGDDSEGDGSGSGAAGLPIECSHDADCAPAGAKCCDCPTHAVLVTDPAYRACLGVACPMQDCGSPLAAACDTGRCVLRCLPVACDMSCAEGFQTDINGCLICACATQNGAPECQLDSDCARVKADCCGCEMGGSDESVPVNQVTAHDAQLMCPTNPSCPAVNTCAPDLAPRCVQGSCSLVSGPLPTTACGRPDLAICADPDACVLNANDQATMQGVGVCLPPP